MMLTCSSTRFTVKELLQLDFFLEDAGIKVEIVNIDDLHDHKRTVIQMRLRVIDPKKRKTQYKENEAIQFDYNIEKDNPEQVAQEMVGPWHILHALTLIWKYDGCCISECEKASHN